MKTSELIGPALDWAVAKCLGTTNGKDQSMFKFWHIRGYANYSTDWAQGGPIIERELISIDTRFINASVEHPHGRWGWQASCVTEDDKAFWLDGPTPLIAAMRCYVAGKLGDEIDIPEELI